MQANNQLRMMGTVIDIAVESDKAEENVAEVGRMLEIFNHRFSANDDASELMAINHAAGVEAVKVHPQLYHLIEVGKKESLAQPSNLNIAIGPLVQTWRVGFSDAKLPTDAEIKAQLNLTDPQNVLLNPDSQTVFLSQKGMKIDLGSLAKGYIADLVMDYLKSENVKSALVNLGGNVLVYGPNPKRESAEWNIGIQNPDQSRGAHLGIVSIRNQSVVTSGIYERKFVKDGKTYHHIFDKSTGYPIDTDMASLTIVADSSLDCEIWTTRLFGLPIQEVLQTIEQTPTIEGIIINQSEQLFLSKGIKNNFYPIS